MMSRIDDMALFVQVVKAGGLSAAGRKVGLSPASMTSRINKIESRYGKRLLNRNTRNISLTSIGLLFYNGCLRVVDEVNNTENILQDSQSSLRGDLRVSATSDFGRQYVAKALADFTTIHPEVYSHLILSDALINLVEEGVDIAFRFGNLTDSSLVSKTIFRNKRVLCASPKYIALNGLPMHPNDLTNHRCIILERAGQPLNEWFFEKDKKNFSIKVAPYLSCSDGEVIRLWAIHGHGIILKSFIDVKKDLASKKLTLILDEFIRGFNRSDRASINLQVVFPNRKYLPNHVRAFLIFFEQWFTK